MLKIATCPIRRSANKMAEVIPVGKFIYSPGGTCLYEICSPPQHRKFLDFKGDFELKGYWWTIQSVPTISRRLSEVEMEASADKHHLIDAWESFLFEFFSFFRQGKIIAFCSSDRFFWIFLFLMLSKANLRLTTILNPANKLSSFRWIAHKDEGSTAHQGENYFHSYLVHSWWFDGSRWRSGDIQIKTIRWQTAIFSSVEEAS